MCWIRTALPWKIYWKHGFYLRKYFMFWLELGTLILSILCIPKMISTFLLPFYYREGGGGVGVGWGCPSTTCPVCTASWSIHTLQWAEVLHYGSHRPKEESSFDPKGVCVCVLGVQNLPARETGKVRMGRWRSTPRCTGLWLTDPFIMGDIIYKSPKRRVTARKGDKEGGSDGETRQEGMKHTILVQQPTRNRSWSTARTALFPCRAGMEGPRFSFIMKWSRAVSNDYVPKTGKWILSWSTEFPHYKLEITVSSSFRTWQECNWDYLHKGPQKRNCRNLQLLCLSQW